MHLTNLPEEIGSLILSYLDLKSKIFCFECIELRIFFTPSLLKKVILSRSDLATISTLDKQLFWTYGNYISELNLSGIPNLAIENLQPYLTRLKNLEILDVTYTNVFLSDLPGITDENDKLKSLGINYFKNPKSCRTQEIWYECKTIFIKKNISEVHLVVFDFNDSESPQMFLKNVPGIINLKITVADNYRDFWDTPDNEGTTDVEEIIEPNFDKLFYIFRDCRVTHKMSRCLKGVTNINFNAVEFIFAMYLEQLLIFISPVFKNIFIGKCSDMKIEICNSIPLDFMLDGNIIFKAWNKETTEFGEDFFKELYLELKNYFPTYFCTHNNLKIEIVKAKSSWLCVDSCEGLDKISIDLAENLTLTEFCRKDGAVIRTIKPVSMSPNIKNLSNLTFLRLSNVKLNRNFFATLFGECQKLTTLDIVERRRRFVDDCSVCLSTTIYLASNLKNIKFTSDDVNYEKLFEALSKCVSLENIHVCGYERAPVDEEINFDNLVQVIRNCEGLYSLFIEADMSPEILTLMTAPLRETAQRLGREHLGIEVCDCYLRWNPFLDVFNPSPLHILD